MHKKYICNPGFTNLSLSQNTPLLVRPINTRGGPADPVPAGGGRADRGAGSPPVQTGPHPAACTELQLQGGQPMKGKLPTR